MARPRKKLTMTDFPLSFPHEGRKMDSESDWDYTTGLAGLGYFCICWCMCCRRKGQRGRKWFLIFHHWLCEGSAEVGKDPYLKIYSDLMITLTFNHFNICVKLLFCMTLRFGFYVLESYRETQINS